MNDVGAKKGRKKILANNCSFCGRIFQGKGRKNALKSHLQMHTGYKANVCKVGGKGFRDQDGLIFHEKKHSNGKPFECAICEKSFDKLLDLKRHVERNNQNKEKFLECSVCEQKFDEYCLLISHRSNHFKCNVCEKSFGYKHHLDRHKIVHLKENFVEE